MDINCWKWVKIILLILSCNKICDAVDSNATFSTKFYEKSVKFIAFSYLNPWGVPSPLNSNIWKQVCVPQYNITFVIHGWMESIDKTEWIKLLIVNFLALRGNCVFFMDYSKFSSSGYYEMMPHFNGIAAVLKKKIKKIGNFEGTVLFGFSFGSRLAIEAGYEIALEGHKISQIFACDPAGPGFGYYHKDPEKAADFVQCINTSDDKGTTVYNCDQNWRLGVCGDYQIGARNPPMGSHGLCPYFFIASFYNNFIADNLYSCASNRLAKDLPTNLKLGPTETRTSYRGDIFAPTDKQWPWFVNPTKSVQHLLNLTDTKPPPEEFL